MPAATYNPIEDRIDVYLSNARYSAVDQVLDDENRSEAIEEILHADSQDFENIKSGIIDSVERLNVCDNGENIRDANRHAKGIILGEAVYNAIVDEEYDISCLSNQEETKQNLESEFYECISTNIEHELIHRKQFYTSVPHADQLSKTERREKTKEVPFGSLGESFAHFWSLFSRDVLEDQEIRKQRKAAVRQNYLNGDVAADHLQKLFDTYDEFKFEKPETELIYGIFEFQKDIFRKHG